MNIMGRYVTFFSVLLLFYFPILTFAQSAATNDRINWNTNLDFAKSVAKQYNRPLFVFFQDVPPNSITTSVYDNSLSNSIIIEKVNDSFVPVRIQGDDLLQRMYNITRFPTILILDSNGAEIDRVTGIMSADTIFSILEDVLGDLSSSSITNSYAQQDGMAVVYRYDDDGHFIFLAGNEKTEWIHDSGYYTISYMSYHEDNVFHYIRNKAFDKKLAIPKSTSQSVWFWKDDRWEALNDVISAIDTVKIKDLNVDVRSFIEESAQANEE